MQQAYAQNNALAMVQEQLKRLFLIKQFIDKFLSQNSQIAAVEQEPQKPNLPPRTLHRFSSPDSLPSKLERCSKEFNGIQVSLESSTELSQGLKTKINNLWGKLQNLMPTLKENNQDENISKIETLLNLAKALTGSDRSIVVPILELEKSRAEKISSRFDQLTNLIMNGNELKQELRGKAKFNPNIFSRKTNKGLLQLEKLCKTVLSGDKSNTEMMDKTWQQFETVVKDINTRTWSRTPEIAAIYKAVTDIVNIDSASNAMPSQSSAPIINNV